MGDVTLTPQMSRELELRDLRRRKQRIEELAITIQDSAVKIRTELHLLQRMIKRVERRKE